MRKLNLSHFTFGILHHQVLHTPQYQIETGFWSNHRDYFQRMEQCYYTIDRKEEEMIESRKEALIYILIMSRD